MGISDSWPTGHDRENFADETLSMTAANSFEQQKAKHQKKVKVKVVTSLFRAE